MFEKLLREYGTKLGKPGKLLTEPLGGVKGKPVEIQRKHLLIELVEESFIIPRQCDSDRQP
jgi:hypothetical protein